MLDPREAEIALIKFLLATAWTHHKRLHREGLEKAVHYEAFLDMAKDAVSDDEEWYADYYAEITANFRRVRSRSGADPTDDT